MSKKSGLLARQQAIIDQEVKLARFHARVFTLDMVTVALGRLGWGEQRLRKFDDMLTAVSKDYAELVMADSKDDPEIVYAKDVLDRELQQYTGTLFVPYDERYGVKK